MTRTPIKEVFRLNELRRIREQKEKDHGCENHRAGDHD